MDTSKNYSLFTYYIEGAVESFVLHEGELALNVDKPDDAKIVCHITKGRATGIVNFYLKKNGLVSINIQGAPSLYEMCERCCDSVIQQTSIPNSLRKSFTVRNSKKDNIDLFKLELTDTHKFKINDIGAGGNVNIEQRFAVLSGQSIKVSCTLYTNGTFLLQGNVSTLFITVLTESLRWLVDSHQNKTTEFISLQNISNLFSEQIDDLVPKLSVCADDDGVIERMILTSVALFNSGVIVEDYGCYTFGVLKALEGVLKLRLSEDLGPIETLGDFYYFDQPTHRHRLKTTVYDRDLELKKALNKGYNNWVSSRHSTFHADEQISTSTLLSYEQAHEVFVKILDCINDICNNWK